MLQKEFVLGRQAFFPNFELKYQSGSINDRDIEITLDQCPGLKIIQDVMFDANDHAPSAVDMVIKLKCQLGNTENI